MGLPVSPLSQSPMQLLLGAAKAANDNVVPTARKVAEQVWGMAKSEVTPQSVTRGVAIGFVEDSLIGQAVGMVALMALTGYVYWTDRAFYQNKLFTPCGADPRTREDFSRAHAKSFGPLHTHPATPATTVLSPQDRRMLQDYLHKQFPSTPAIGIDTQGRTIPQILDEMTATAELAIQISTLQHQIRLMDEWGLGSWTWPLKQQLEGLISQVETLAHHNSPITSGALKMVASAGGTAANEAATGASANTQESPNTNPAEHPLAPSAHIPAASRFRVFNVETDSGNVVELNQKQVDASGHTDIPEPVKELVRGLPGFEGRYSIITYEGHDCILVRSSDLQKFAVVLVSKDQKNAEVVNDYFFESNNVQGVLFLHGRAFPTRILDRVEFSDGTRKYLLQTGKSKMPWINFKNKMPVVGMAFSPQIAYFHGEQLYIRNFKEFTVSDTALVATEKWRLVEARSAEERVLIWVEESGERVQEISQEGDLLFAIIPKESFLGPEDNSGDPSQIFVVKKEGDAYKLLSREEVRDQAQRALVPTPIRLPNPKLVKSIGRPEMFTTLGDTKDTHDIPLHSGGTLSIEAPELLTYRGGKRAYRQQLELQGHSTTKSVWVEMEATDVPEFTRRLQRLGSILKNIPIEAFINVRKIFLSKERSLKNNHQGDYLYAKKLIRIFEWDSLSDIQLLHVLLHEAGHGLFHNHPNGRDAVLAIAADGSNLTRQLNPDLERYSRTNLSERMAEAAVIYLYAPTRELFRAACPFTTAFLSRAIAGSKTPTK